MMYVGGLRRNKRVMFLEGKGLLWGVVSTDRLCRLNSERDCVCVVFASDSGSTCPCMYMYSQE